MRIALRGLAAIRRLRLPQPPQPGRPALAEPLEDLDTLPGRAQDRHGAGGPDPRAPALGGGALGPRSAGQPRGASRPFLAPAEAAGPLLADRPDVQRAGIALP